ncbi:Protein SODIUM POTASSIUM ROOT DEFECTIVE 2 [Vigna angularis]|uniref:Protein SODIUM POTASSIUM ROOT DEFECTIVE 2 n=3 Tax=Phaseolus angularis TaxID=3914 RepID=A0A8T0KSF8_PHAAN|nr:protein SODIUM POTASSIUM ROOT DEFECTIVE 2 [Vigna angularis]KAG2402646.1 Protein SODIUM POTASSIUM ROOT DEFECTIVE 2 [Vigna angularis]BAT95412.1 hypothetical protein VIGAN_08212700 [Vigna angularis var. angularis]
MKRMEIFCASEASTAICLSTDQASCSSSSNTILLGGRVIDRHNPIINDSRRSTSKSLTAPCSSSHSPINPKPYHELHKPNKNSCSKTPTKEHQNHKNKNTTQHLTNTSKPVTSLKPPSASITPHASTRSLLAASSLLDSSSHYDPVFQDENIPVSKLSSSSHPKSCSSDQVVVLRVSLHCKGCEGKVRKHLSRMQGVTSFDIDFAAKKVTVVGDVTPLSVLASISKVKNAQLWPATASATVETK